MALTDAIARLLGWRRVVVYDHSVVAASIAGMTPTDLYRRQPALRAVVSFLADNVAGVPIKCYVREGDTDRPRDTESPLALLLARPGCGMTTFELVRATVSDLKLWGQALWFVVPEPDAKSGWAIRYVPWAWVSGKQTDDGFEPSAYEVTNPYATTQTVLPAEWCVRFYGYHPRGVMEAASPIEALKDVLSEQISAWEFRNGVWRNGGRVSQWISRPAGAEWAPGARNRFMKSWKERYSGRDGDNTGGTPLLEDGMRLETTQLNAREAQWQEATRLAREDVAAVYHVNPSQIWHSESQTYASAKDNARALYADTLANDFSLIEQRINAVLVPMLGMDPSRNYCEFDLSAKLAASFEEQAGVLQSSVGGPWMLRNEARARMNLPALPGGDELIVPLNVVEGGLASPNDTDPTKAAPLSNHMAVAPEMSEQLAKALAEAIVLAATQLQKPQAKALPEGEGRRPGSLGDGFVQEKARPTIDPTRVAEGDVKDVLRRFYERQATSIANRLAATSRDDVLHEGTLEWWGKERWTSELGLDLTKVLTSSSEDMATRALRELRLDAALFDRTGLSEAIGELCAVQADNIVQSTLERLTRDLRGIEEWTPDVVRGCVEESMQRTSTRYLVRNARSLANSAANASVITVVGDALPGAKKKWITTGVNTRSAHAMMHGQTVDIGDTFSNGAMWPGDPILGAAGTVNCRCRVEVIRDKHNSYDHGVGNAAFFRRHETAVGDVDIAYEQFGHKATEHMKQFGIDPTSGEGRNDYRRLALRFLQQFDEVLYGEWHAVTEYPAFFFRIGEDIMIVMEENLEFVSMFPRGIYNERIKRARHWL